MGGKKEQFLGNGRVRIDGKEVSIADLAKYRAGDSTRQRSRVRGGVQIRSKDTWSAVSFLLFMLFWFFCVHLCATWLVIAFFMWCPSNFCCGGAKVVVEGQLISVASKETQQELRAVRSEAARLCLQYYVCCA